ncbi:AAA family ATPase [Pseudomonas aeruginosa]|uniref:AAA family ATPase n=1 Tax=Pseudomonas aeruginosa TaxID=287 RepID=UPI00201D9010|nr:AAA family ATPase [Pseudomonas aeruginosa]MCM1993598.1 AAA family ATPase [Pseudomonas aeruginosa]MCM2002055.1 AAA family ATPase [Pseudomonas aeruginosa]MCM2007008.1 AAA family ATPase [Pseudomonas aeruginosa]MCM2016005.1 AAA family ATPase [Pseudomonas aeruginosa]MCM2022786.1 AAA family ATPase [Pseudomonas aeruginosa]
MTTRFESSGIPEELKAHARWVAWRYMERDGQPKPAKVPTDPKTGRNASPTDPATWADFQTAEAYARQHGVGVGLVLSAESGLCCIDLDATNDPAVQGVHRGILDEAAAAGAYIEASPSGKGWHIWVQHDEAVTAPRAVPGVECYTAERFITVTGASGQGSVVPMPDSLASRLAPCFAAPIAPVVAAASVELPAISDEALWEQAAERFGDRFQAFWTGQWQSLHPSQSEADHEFAIMLARFTSDPNQWLRLFLRSGMAATLDRKKTKRHIQQYLSMTYDKARRKADEENYHISFGRRAAEAIIARWNAMKAALTANLLEPFAEFIQKKVLVLKLVRGILGEGGLSVLYGAPGAGKSFLALDLGYAVATGQPWMGRDTRQGPVIYAAGEGVSGLRMRGKAIAKVKHCDAPNIFFLPHSLSTPDEGEKMAMVLDQVTARCGVPPALLIIDTLSRFFGEGDDENSAKDMKRFVGAISALMAKCPTLHVMIVHHSGKDADKGMRGSSALQGAADTVIQCRKDGDAHRAVVEKQKDGQDNIPLPFALDQVELGEDEDGEPITSCVVVHDHEGKARPLTGWTATAVKVLRQLKASVMASGGGGNLSTDIPLIAYHNHWYQERPEDKKDTVRKNARRQLETLREKKLLEWNGGESPIRLLPAFDGVTIE